MTVVRGNTGVELDLPDDVIVRFKNRPNELRLLVDTFADLYSTDRVEVTGAEWAAVLQYAERQQKRAIRIEQAAKGGAVRWAEESDAVMAAIRQAIQELQPTGSKRRQAQKITPRVNEILRDQGLKERAENTIREKI